MTRHLARWRVTLGFACAAVAFGLARPTAFSLTLGLGIAALGEALRIWASGHLEKGREITRSGPYRFFRHPLYLGSVLLAAGFLVAGRSWIAAVLGAVYVAATFAAAILSEEATLDERFAGQYSQYRAGSLEPTTRRFSWSRVTRNREYRAVAGLIAAFLVLAVVAVIR
jgi:hypothetical protein